MATQQTTRWLLGALLLLMAASTAHAETIDLAAYFPNAQMSRTHVLQGTQGNWDLRPMLADGQYNIFYGHDLSGGWLKDVYVVTDSTISLVMNVLDDAIINYLQPYPSLPRHIDLAMLPIATETMAYPVHKTNAGVVTILEAGPSPVTISREGALIKLHWGDDVNYEILYIGEVQIQGTRQTAPGMARYKTSLQGGIDTWFTWVAR
jgi:hypothetical protein